MRIRLHAEMSGLARTRSALGISCASALVSVSATGVAPAATSTKPTIRGLGAYPSTVPSGGTTGVSAVVGGARECTLSAAKGKPVSGLPVTFACSAGSAMRVLAMPADTGKKATLYKLTLVATAESRHTAKAKVTVTVQPEAVGVANKELIALGYYSTCAIVAHGKDTGAVRCWGGKGQGALGDGGSTSGYSPTPVPVVGIANAVEVAGGNEHACALLATGHIKCWGKSVGLGNGSYAGEFGESTPVAVVKITNAVQITAGDGDACALLTTGHVDCWGANNVGQLGQKTLQVENYTPLEIPEFGGVVELAAGREHTCARLQGGKVDCWGRNTEGELGNGPGYESVPTPGAVGEVTGARDIASGEAHSCAVLAEEGRPVGQIKCWGWDKYGQLGDDSVGDVKRPVFAQEGMLQPIAGAMQVSAGNEHTCALLKGGTVACWGSDAHGQLGDGQTNEEHVAVQVPRLAHVVEVDASQLHSCALLEDGAIKCWGSDPSGELGNGTVQPYSTELVAVSGFPSAKLAHHGPPGYRRHCGGARHWVRDAQPVNRSGNLGAGFYRVLCLALACSNSTGGSPSHAPCRRLWLYQSTHSRVASSTWSIVFHGPCRLISSVL
jgi:alpha-tubulin suppressor-like RCC1 family protein